MARMRKYGERKTTRIMMATVPHVTSGLGLRKFQADEFFIWHECTFVIRSRWISVETRDVSEKIGRQNHNTVYVKQLFPPRSCPFWGNVEIYSTAGQVTNGSVIRRMRLACWITMSTDTHPEYVIFLAYFTAKMVARIPLNVRLIRASHCWCLNMHMKSF